MPHEEPFSDWIGLGQTAEDPILDPTLSATGDLVLVGDERVLRQLRTSVSISVIDGKRIVDLVKMETEAIVFFTTDRLVFHWPRWQSDRAAGSFLQRRVMMPALLKEDGPQTLGGQVRHDWMLNVGLTKPTGLLAKKSALVTWAQTNDGIFRIAVEGLAADAARELAVEYAAAIAERRLSTGHEFSDEDRRALENVQARASQFTATAWGQKIELVKARRYPHLFATHMSG